MPNATPGNAGWLFDEYDAPRFWSHVNFHGGYDFTNDNLARVTAQDGECWTWTGWRRGDYGCFTVWESRQAAHRLAYRDCGNNLPDHLDIDHLCRNTLCVNPNHLEAVPGVVNVARGSGPLRNRTHCNHGHALTPDNLWSYTTSDGSTRTTCKQCKSARAAAYYKRKTSSSPS